MGERLRLMVKTWSKRHKNITKIKINRKKEGTFIVNVDEKNYAKVKNLLFFDFKSNNLSYSNSNW